MWTGLEIYSALKLEIGVLEKNNFNGISINSKKINKGSLFIPIKGPRFDGHNFIEEALKKGASGALAEKSYFQKLVNFRKHLILVDDTYKSLIQLAEFSRKRAKENIVISITGSSGKTTLKEWLRKVMSNYFTTYANYGNLNNQIGVPLTLANMPSNSKVSIIEVGMNKVGEIAKLAKIIKPNIAIITNISSAHIGNFRKKKDIAFEKSQIFKYLKNNDTAIIPKDDKYFTLLREQVSNKNCNIFTFGKKEDSKFKILNSKDTDYPSFLINQNKITVEFKYPDDKWKFNVAIILGVSSLLKLNLSKVSKKVLSLKPLRGRGMFYNLYYKKKKFTLIDESYNSNPKSLEDSLKLLGQKRFAERRKIIVLGDMLELGSKSNILHKGVIPYLENLKPYSVITVGLFTKVIHKNLNNKISTFHFNTYENVYNKIIDLLKNGDLITIKGSNSIKLDKVCAKLKKMKN